jgi:hypothetical protein
VPDFLVSIGLKYVETVSTPSEVGSSARKDQGLTAHFIAFLFTL